MVQKHQVHRRARAVGGIAAGQHRQPQAHRPQPCQQQQPGQEIPVQQVLLVLSVIGGLGGPALHGALVDEDEVKVRHVRPGQAAVQEV